MAMAVFYQGDPTMIDYTPGSAVNAGDVVGIGSFPYVAHLDIAASALGAIAARNGIYTVTGDGAIPAGSRVFWDSAAQKCTLSMNTTQINPVFGESIDACGGSGQTFHVLHNPEEPVGIVSGLPIESAADALTAHAGGGQANALQLVAEINRVTTVATTADSVKLVTAAPGLSQVVINAGANSMNVFPAMGDQINALGVNTAFAVAATKVVTFYSTVAGQWHSQLTA